MTRHLPAVRYGQRGPRGRRPGAARARGRGRHIATWMLRRRQARRKMQVPVAMWDRRVPRSQCRRQREGSAADARPRLGGHDPRLPSGPAWRS